MFDNFGDRMKGYENVNKTYLMRQMPIIIRLDGKSFSSFTKGFDKPFDYVFMKTMIETAKYLCENIPYCKLAYVQSDEISLLINNYENFKSEPWFNNNIQKIVSISASMATLSFNNNFKGNVAIHEHFNTETIKSLNMKDEEKYFKQMKDKLTNVYINKINTALFDSRVFNLPEHEVCNYFIWRQQDATKNAINMVGQYYFSHNELQNKSCNETQELLFQKHNVNFNDYPVTHKRGTCIIKIPESVTYDYDGNQSVSKSKFIMDDNIPIFTSNRHYIEKYIDGGSFYEKINQS